MDKLDKLIEYLLKERPDRKYIPKDLDKFQLYRYLVNPRMPGGLSEEYLQMEEAFLKEYNQARGITKLSDLKEIEDGIYLWKGDITTLEVDAIVNAANARLLGCMSPLHNCIDNAIHTYAGLSLREECSTHKGYTSCAVVTKGYGLPANHVIHTVGPIISGPLRDEDRKALSLCYENCLKAGDFKSIAFCSISTGVFAFPKREAARIAVDTVRRLRPENTKVVFNVFSDEDYEIYRSTLG
ncbi:MAG: protein-ADP-ribose hydrolase [Clostridia bacterium]|nr:protein-ADP-ribose hydrolase [Clostridia bacterium]